MRNGRCWERMRSVRRTGGSASSSWATPTARDWKDGADPSDEVLTNGLLGRAAPRWAMPNAQGGTGYMSGSSRDTWRPTLKGQVRGEVAVLHRGRRDQTTQDGAPTSSSGLRLSPLFVQALLGFPLGWTWPYPIGQTSSAHSATPSAHRKPKKPSGGCS
jgi:hypothetical protein